MCQNKNPRQVIEKHKIATVHSKCPHPFPYQSFDNIGNGFQYISNFSATLKHDGSSVSAHVYRNNEGTIIVEFYSRNYKLTQSKVLNGKPHIRSEFTESIAEKIRNYALHIFNAYDLSEIFVCGELVGEAWIPFAITQQDANLMEWVHISNPVVTDLMFSGFSVFLPCFSSCVVFVMVFYVTFRWLVKMSL